jgi:flagellar biosynthesis/type III secretory pathway chaperone
MKSTCQELSEILTAQMEIYNLLLEIAAQKRGHLIKGSLEELNEVTKQEELYILQLGKLEEKRENCFSQLADQGGWDRNCSLQEVIPQLPEEEQNKLVQIQEGFAAIIEKLADLNQENTSLIQQSLRFINFTVDVLNEQSKPLYNAEREVKIKQLNNLLDKKV